MTSDQATVIAPNPKTRSVPSRSTVRLKSIGSAAIPFIIVLGLWQLLGASTGPRSIFLPTPSAVVSAFKTLLGDGDFYADVAWSIYRISVGFMLSILVAVPVGFMAGRFKLLGAMIHPINDFTRYLPVVSLIPLCILWTGIGEECKILIIFIGTVFQLMPLVSDAAATVPETLVDMTRVYGASRSKIITKVVIPWCLPTIFDHCRIALGWAWSYLIVAEIVATTSGIGRVIIQAQRFIQTPRVIAGIIVIGILGLSFDQLFRFARPRLFPWA